MASTTTAPIIKNPSLLRFLRGLWWVYVVICAIVIVVALPQKWEATINGTTANDISTEEFAEINEAFLEGIDQLPISIEVYAAFKIALNLITGVIFVGVAYIIFQSRAQERIGMLTAFCFLCMGTFIFIMFPDDHYSYDNQQFQDILINLAKIIAGTAWPTLFIILVVYPDGRVTPRWSLIGILIGIITPEGVGDSLGILFIGLVFGIPLAAQVYRYRRISTPLQRQQTKWFVSALALMFILIFVKQAFLAPHNGSEPIFTVFYDLLDALLFLLFTLLPIAVGFAILRYRLWDIDLVVNRSLVYGIVIALALGLLFAIISAIQILGGGTQPLIAIIIAGGISAFAFRPVQTRVQGFVDHRIFRLAIGLNELKAAQKKPEIKNPGALTGKILGGYEILDTIGKGGMGEVYKGFKDGETVAIKTLPSELAQRSDYVRRFQREAEVMQSLDHPSILKIRNSGVSDGIHWLAIDYVDGVDLKQHLEDNNQRLSLEDALDLLRDIASALDYAHSKHFIHRDIKPSNIMLYGDDPIRAMVMDFGITKVENAHTRITASGAIGTIDYMAPEQIMAAREVDQRADVYALGIMVYEMLTGELPFVGSPAQVMFAQIQKPAPNPRDVNDEIPKNIAKAILKALDKKPENRFASAGEFVAQLDASHI